MNTDIINVCRRNRTDRFTLRAFALEMGVAVDSEDAITKFANFTLDTFDAGAENLVKVEKALSSARKKKRPNKKGSPPAAPLATLVENIEAKPYTRPASLLKCILKVIRKDTLSPVQINDRFSAKGWRATAPTYIRKIIRDNPKFFTEPEPGKFQKASRKPTV